MDDVVFNLISTP